MKELEERIRRDGKQYPGGVLKVDSFLNHQIDITLYQRMGQEFARLFAGERVNKLLTVEASGIGIACITAQYFPADVVFAKKSRTKNLGREVWSAQVESFTHGNTCEIVVEKAFLTPGDRVLLIDDFLANGSALRGLRSLCTQAGAEVVGAGICVEKAFQSGGEALRQEGLRIESLARIKTMTDTTLEFC